MSNVVKPPLGPFDPPPGNYLPTRDDSRAESNRWLDAFAKFPQFSTQDIAANLKQVLNVNDCGSDVSSSSFGDALSYANLYKAQTIALGVLRAGRPELVKCTQDQLQADMIRTAGYVIKAIHRDLVNKYVAGMQLFYNGDFHSGVWDTEIYMFAERIISPDWINNQLIELYGGGNYTFVEAVACFFELMRPRLNVPIHPMYKFEAPANDPGMDDVAKASAVEHWSSVALEKLGASQKYHALMALASPVSWSSPVGKWAADNEALGISFDFLGQEFNEYWSTDGEWANIFNGLLNAQTPTYDYEDWGGRWGGRRFYRNGTAYGRDFIHTVNTTLVSKYPDVFNQGVPRTDGNGYDKTHWVDPDDIQFNPDGTIYNTLVTINAIPTAPALSSTRKLPRSTGPPENKSPVPINHPDFRKQILGKVANAKMDAGSVVASFHLLDWVAYHKERKGLQVVQPSIRDRVDTINAGRSLPTLSVCNGVLLADNNLVPLATISSSQIQWSRLLKDQGSDVWEHGVLQVSGDWMLLHGAIYVGPSPASSTLTTLPKDTSSIRVMGLQHAVDHHMLCSQDTFETTYAADHCAYPSGASSWADFYLVEHGLAQSKPDGGVRITAILPDLDRNWNDADLPIYSVTATVLPGWLLRIVVTVTPGLESTFQQLMTAQEWKPGPGHPGLPSAFHDILLTVDMATNIVSGHYTELTGSDDVGWQAGPIHAIYGPASPKLTGLKELTSQLVATRSRLIPDRTEAPDTRPATSPFLRRLADMVVKQDDPPVAFLQSMHTPEDYDLHGLSQHYMAAAASWWRGDDEKKLFGDAKQENDWLPVELKGGLAGNLSSFLSGHFSKALLVRSLSTNGNYQDKFSDDDRDKLTYWWQGKSPHCLSRFGEYNDLTVTTAHHAFVDSVPDLKPYLTSSLDYAQSFYETITDDDLLENLAMSVIVGDQNMVNRHCAVLNALDDQGRKYDRQLWDLVQQKQIMALAQGSPEFAEDFSPFAVDYMRSLMQKIATGDPSIQKDFLDELKADINDLASILEATAEKDLAFQLFDSASEFGANILSAIDLLSKRPSRNGQAGAPGFFQKMQDAAKNNPKVMRALAVGKGIIMVVMQGYVLYNAIRFLMSWDDLTPAQRADAILQALEATMRGLYEIVGVYKAIKGVETSSLEFRRECVKWNRASSKKVQIKDDEGVEMTVLNKEKIEDVPRIGPSGEVDPTVPKKSMSEQMVDNVTDKNAVDEAVKEFSVSEVAISGVMIALNIAITVTMGMQLKEEWNQTNIDDGIRAMDTINLIVQCAQVISGAVEVVAVVVGSQCVAIPALGVVVLAAGMVMMLLESFISHPKPDPVGDYVKDHATPFIQDLDPRPKPQLTYSASVSFSADKKTVVLKIEVTQPANISPAPEIGQLIFKIFAGDRDADLFLPPSLDKNGRVVPDTDITWTVNDTTKFTAQGRDNPDSNSHSILSKVFPTKPATKDPGKVRLKSGARDPGTSILGDSKLVVQVRGGLNPAFKEMTGTITEVISNAPDDVLASDVVYTYTVSV